ncbi:hypothetical protein C8R44DRAFT_880550 [Mycena epipterygia]|nr:hypothetical protein C8R44DRAFT_880550 [Mycena epipterygia]
MLFLLRGPLNASPHDPLDDGPGTSHTTASAAFLTQRDRVRLRLCCLQCAARDGSEQLESLEFCTPLHCPSSVSLLSLFSTTTGSRSLSSFRDRLFHASPLTCLGPPQAHILLRRREAHRLRRARARVVPVLPSLSPCLWYGADGCFFDFFWCFFVFLDCVCVLTHSSPSPAPARSSSLAVIVSRPSFPSRRSFFSFSARRRVGSRSLSSSSSSPSLTPWSPFRACSVHRFRSLPPLRSHHLPPPSARPPTPRLLDRWSIIAPSLSPSIRRPISFAPAPRISSLFPLSARFSLHFSPPSLTRCCPCLAPPILPTHISYWPPPLILVRSSSPARSPPQLSAPSSPLALPPRPPALSALSPFSSLHPTLTVRGHSLYKTRIWMASLQDAGGFDQYPPPKRLHLYHHRLETQDSSPRMRMAQKYHRPRILDHIPYLSRIPASDYLSPHRKLYLYRIPYCTPAISSHLISLALIYSAYLIPHPPTHHAMSLFPHIHDHPAASLPILHVAHFLPAHTSLHLCHIVAFVPAVLRVEKDDGTFARSSADMMRTNLYYYDFRMLSPMHRGTVTPCGPL